MLVFAKRENRSTRRKTSWSRVENQQTQTTYDAGAGNRTRATLVEGERSHHCADPAPIDVFLVFLPQMFQIQLNPAVSNSLSKRKIVARVRDKRVRVKFIKIYKSLIWQTVLNFALFLRR